MHPVFVWRILHNPEDVWVFVKLHFLLEYAEQAMGVRVNVRALIGFAYICLLAGLAGLMALNMYALVQFDLQRHEVSGLGADLAFCVLLLVLSVKFFIAFLTNNIVSILLRIVYTICMVMHTAFLFSLIVGLQNISLGYTISATFLSLLNMFELLAILFLIFISVDVALIAGEFLIRLVICKLTNPCYGLLTFHSRALAGAKRVEPARVIKLSAGTPFRSQGATQTRCAICLSDFEEQQLVCGLRCHITHAFHRRCLEAWARQSAACPICRQGIECIS